ncbi:MAG: CocE/NonD family hydrolase, partial [Anaerolineales bacterium]|nr:CocE/NonD family hydrolase [Anaerolineales bacterium]
GDAKYFVPRGYVQVIADPRGIAKSEGEFSYFGLAEQEDGYDIIEWIAEQPWCDGNVGMIGHSWFAMNQYLIAAQNPPHLKSIFPHSGATDIYRQFIYHGGIFHFGFVHHLWRLIPAHRTKPLSLKEFSKAGFDKIIKDIQDNIDIRSVPYMYLSTLAYENNPWMLDLLAHPHDGPFYSERSAYDKYDKIKIPCYVLACWYECVVHLPGAFDAYRNLDVPKKLMITANMATRPWRQEQDIVLRWHDHWLKGNDTGMMDEPPITIFIMGTNQWRYEQEWPLARTKWAKFYLRQNGELSQLPPAIGEDPDKDSFTNLPWQQQSDATPCLKYTTYAFTEDVEVTGPIALYLQASLSTDDANWIAAIYDVHPDGSTTPASKGWLKASHRELDEAKSRPHLPVHSHTRSVPVEPGKLYEYAIEMGATANVFKSGHKMQLVIKGQDNPWEDGAILYHASNMTET